MLVDVIDDFNEFHCSILSSISQFEWIDSIVNGNFDSAIHIKH